MDMPDFAFYNNADYFRQLATDIRATKSGARIAVATMSIDTRDTQVQRIFEELVAAAKRRATVLVAIDARTFLVDEDMRIPGPFWFKPTLEQSLREPFKSFSKHIDQLRAAGASVTLTNVPRKSLSNIAAGRSHIKASVINNRVYVGGCNLQDSSYLDVMVSWQDKQTADWLFDMAAQMVKHGSTHKAFRDQDTLLELSPVFKLVRDAGIANQSLILNTAVRLVDASEGWVMYTGQFFPNGPIYKALLGAVYRGARVEIYYAHPSIHGLEEPIHRLYNLRGQTVLTKKATVHQLPKDAPKLHAKVLATENGAMVGSHNYIQQGVKWGTAELALLCNEPGFSRKVKSFIVSEIEKNS